MAKPRVFVSSTYYDLRHIRNSLESFIEQMGYEPVLFESGDIPFLHDLSITESCYDEVEKCHMLILIIGGRYGSNADPAAQPRSPEDKQKMYDLYNSVTKQEYERARGRNTPIFIFVEKGVRGEYETYKNNRENSSIDYAHVDSVNVFKLLDEILKQGTNNYVKDFDRFADIANWLRDQWAGLFAEFLGKKRAETGIRDLSSQVSQLTEVTAALKSYAESIIKKVEPDNFERIVETEERKMTQSRFRRFRNEPLISYLMDTAAGEAKKLFKELQHASTVEEFLRKAGVSEEYIQDFLRKHSSVANEDFNALKKKYKGSGDLRLLVE